ncbi:MAG: proline--tRNA ligase [Candidatus Omnitrophica bacterium]|nr:proline--tRNA ligase [Candidatus Omnitrophota bacterium]MDD5592391.1 proline--tRNA ligase [Candidatus Omnitrophota bacterium]
MFWSKDFIPTLKETPQEAESISHQLMLRAGLVRMLMAGVYSYLPLGLKVLDNIQKIIRQELNSCGATELLLPALQPQELWVKSGRDKDIGEVMIRFTDRRGRNMCLGPTHEEVITDLVKNHISSYKQLPLILYQIQTKFRDEIRPRFGLIRACEFIMKDAYSFDADEAGLDKNYQVIHNAYKRIFKKCGLSFLTTQADPGVMGGNMSHEFMAPAQDGEDIVSSCPKCRLAKTFKDGEEQVCPQCGVKLEKINTIEVGHIFKLGTKYSAVLGANFIDAQGQKKPIIMGCYGIGVSRLISAVIEQNHDKDGIIWPKDLSPYQVAILPLDTTDKKIMQSARDLYEQLTQEGIGVLLDDRDERAGVKFKDADLIGVTLQVIIGKESLKKNTLELKIRRNHKKIIKTKAAILKEIKELVNG